ncbi:hypothetical protein [Paractinoplanes toevensis]|uniref:Uncharacterized protein n=1 Tax=Paractinoplanes toevensis TaxID=571911 RepID=A0A919VZN5_9ACTN|nr:hypothetical protein [Actinoplanes toevensis]GIM90317.1 hypothetical protein Ato02nite_021100 [Actinoplanes toevensis]
MKKTMIRMFAAVALAGAAGSVALTLATAGSASAAGRGPQPVSNRLTTVKANTPSWVNIFWRTNRPVCAVRVSVDGGREVAVAYPGMRRSTTFTTGDSLRPGRTAVTPIRVTPVRRTSGVSILRATVSYTDCSRKARTQFTQATLALPVIRTGRPMGQQFPGQQGHQGQQGQQFPGQQGHQFPGQQGHQGQMPGQQHQAPVQHGQQQHQAPVAPVAPAAPAAPVRR